MISASTRRIPMVQTGVIDPTKVVRLALENAASAASLLLLSEATLMEVRRRKRTPAPLLFPTNEKQRRLGHKPYFSILA